MRIRVITQAASSAVAGLDQAGQQGCLPISGSGCAWPRVSACRAPGSMTEETDVTRAGRGASQAAGVISSVSLGGLWIWFRVTQSIFNPTCYPLGLRFSSILMGQRWNKGEAQSMHPVLYP